MVRRAEPSDAKGIAHVHVETWRTTYRGIVPDDYLSKLSLERSERTWESALTDIKKRTGMFVAVDDLGNVIGFAACGSDRDNDPIYNGELYAVYVLQHVQRSGIGRQLVLAVIEELKSRGLSSLLVWVLADNPSKGFYEAISGDHVQTREIIIGGKKLTEFGYGWTDLDSLTAILGKRPHSIR
jgi:ribosomal protein S18 acetylase RimI-like enzyme